MLAINHHINQHINGFHAQKYLDGVKVQAPVVHEKKSITTGEPGKAAVILLKNINLTWKTSRQIAEESGVGIKNASSMLWRLHTSGLLESKRDQDRVKVYRAKKPTNKAIRIIIGTFGRYPFTVNDITECGYNQAAVQSIVSEQANNGILFRLGRDGGLRERYRTNKGTSLDLIYSLITNAHNKPVTYGKVCGACDLDRAELPTKARKMLANKKRYPGLKKLAIGDEAALQFIGLNA